MPLVDLQYCTKRTGTEPVRSRNANGTLRDTYMDRTTTRIMLDAEFIWTRSTGPLGQCLTLLALLAAFIAMSLGALRFFIERSAMIEPKPKRR